MSRIRRLPEHVANRIAAGEVVERPASLAKELIENALDAGAERIEISFAGGGAEMLRVSDDGCGIPAAEVALAFERHATSKISAAEDLEAIRTLGFRGEALASIAAVARVELLTAVAGEPSGTRIRIEGGRILVQEPAARAPGTTIEVGALFFNTPARRKFLRQPATEGRVLVQTVGQLALGAPGVGFRVVREGRVVLEIAASAGFGERVQTLFGRDTRARMAEVRGGRAGLDLTGLVAPTEFARTRGTHQVLIVNGRPVSDPALAHAVKAGIGGSLPGGRHPIFALVLEVDPARVDVNVHPTKREIRFAEKDRVYALVRESVGAAVLGAGFDVLGREGVLPWRRAGEPAAKARPSAGTAASVARASAPTPETVIAPSAPAPPREREAEEPREVPLARKLRLVGELWGSYLIVEDVERLLVIDQHAAHERVLYDEIRRTRDEGKTIPVQGLLVPLTIDLAPGHEPEEAAGILQAMGFDARPGGPGSLLVDGIPGNLTRWGGGEFLRDFFASGEAARASAEKLRDALAKTYACKRAVKFGQRLHPQEIEYLLDALSATAVPRLCPHGRPLYLEITRDQIDDRFERS
jgi:DNA mismatch repair protein MutL